MVHAVYFSEQCNHVIVVRKDQALSLNALKLLQQVIGIVWGIKL